MTTICAGGGPSQVKAGVVQNFYLTGGALALFASGLGLTWLAEALGFIAGINFVLPSLCATDPPADPGITAADISCIILPVPGVCNQPAAIQKVVDLIERYAWFQWCECVSGTQPTAPALPTPPSNIPTVNPTNIIGAGGQALCLDTTITFPIPHIATQRFTTGLPGVTTQSIAGNSLFAPFQVIPQPPPVRIQVNWSTDTTGPHADAYSIALTELAADHSQLASHGVVLAGAGTSGVFTYTPDPLTYAQHWEISPNNTTNQSNFATVHIQEWCQSNPFGSAGPQGCCPPDPTLSSAIQDVQTLVTQLQRYLLPFAYVFGTVHSGISGTGSFAITSLSGMKISVTSVPPFAGESVRDVNKLFELGWVSIQTADGLIDQIAIDRVERVWQSRLFPEATLFGFFCTPGTVIELTEVMPEP